ncbi:MAG: trans-2-enoyl-CoA reductase family protein [Gammaproteobacteria bacterium]|nr:trans-2-enoyl-CoA reductase family protein [Gammaproteobacteria bacterium]MDE0366283.1 trans-2-enoyl-CoA reductase family protein [Gammaproteobacteria bacterium]
MVIKPRIRGFICTTAHPRGCAAHVNGQIEYIRSAGPIDAGVKNALVVGCSGGYGLASRIVAAAGCGADTLGVSLEKPPSSKRTATAGWYNNLAFEEAVDGYARTLDGDAFSDELKADAVEAIRNDMGKLDLLVYSLASPVRRHPRTGFLHRSALKPLGETLRMKSLNVDKGEVIEVALEPGTEDDIANTVAVMGGEDWEMWIDALAEADLLAPGFRTLAFTYLGSDLTWPIYWEGTLGKAKEDVDRAAAAITRRLAHLGGSARVASLKAVVTQASSAIPVVSLYMALLFRIMKERGLHEDCIRHIYRLYATQLATGATQRLDEAGRIRVDDVELSEPIQGEVKRRWGVVATENIAELGDLPGFREDFLKIFGFGLAGVDYEEDLDPALGRDVR